MYGIANRSRTMKKWSFNLVECTCNVKIVFVQTKLNVHPLTYIQCYKELKEVIISVKCNVIIVIKIES